MRVLYLVLGGLCFALAVAGVMLPVLPTTPFLLLTSFCLVRSYPALDRRLRNSPIFGAFLEDWHRHHGVRLHVKVTALVTLVIGVGVSWYTADLSNLGLGLLLGLGAIGALVVLRLKTVRSPP